MANNELIDEVISAVLYNKAMHDQATWGSAHTPDKETEPDFHNPDCGATACIAGWACILSGQQLKWTMPSWEEDDDGNMFVSWCMELVGNEDDIQAKARELLGLSYNEANTIFLCMNEEKALDMLKAVQNGEKIAEDDYEDGSNMNDYDGDPEFDGDRY
jgi:hypothetical protein